LEKYCLESKQELFDLRNTINGTLADLDSKMENLQANFEQQSASIASTQSDIAKQNGALFNLQRDFMAALQDFSKHFLHLKCHHSPPPSATTTQTAGTSLSQPWGLQQK
jgi:peptidoglycan hydrolase CwlO-like protein